MQEVDAGHIYELAELGSDETQTLRFIKRSGGAIAYDQEWAGVQTQEVLRVLIRRTLYLNAVIPCKESNNAVWHLRMSLWEYEARAYRRKLAQLNRKDGQHPDGSTGQNKGVIADDIPFGIIDIPCIIDGIKGYYNIEEVPIGEDGHLIGYVDHIKRENHHGNQDS